MNIDVRVVVIPDTEKSSDGVVATDAPLNQLRDDIVEELGLGSSVDWDIAIMPAAMSTTLARYKPVHGDTLLLVKKTSAKGPSFKRRGST